LSLPCLAEQLELLGDRPEVRLNGARLPAQPLPEKYGFASFGVPRAAASNPQLELFRLPLAHARRSDVVAAVLRAGAKRLEENAHVSKFDVASLAWPHTTTLKILFDGHGLFVKAHWEGNYAGTKQTEVLVALRDEFGEPTRIHRTDGTLVLRWAFADGLEIHYSRPAKKDSATCPLAELSFVDPVAYTAFETAVNAAQR
jgi:hypothetical protein